MKRSKHSLSHYKLLTCDMGKLVPIGLQEVLPGDTFQHSTSMLVRMSPLMAPVMHPVSVRVHHWFVPNRLLWEKAGGVGTWEDFITGGKDGLGNGSVYPTNAAPVTVESGDLFDYMGIPVGKTFPIGALNTMPIAAYNFIYNEFYRDEDLINEVSETDKAVKNVSWEKDYFTSARPWSQKGPAVTVPIGGTGAVTITGKPTSAPQWVHPGGVSGIQSDANGNAIWGFASGAGRGTSLNWSDPNLQGTVDLSNATSSDIIEFRRAFALQRYQEARAQYGSRYTEYLRYLGIRSSDARLQRPEYLGGGKQTVAFSEVLRTGNDEAATASPIGEMKGHGISAMRSNRYRYFSEEHGYILSLLSLRPRSMYNDGVGRTWSRRTKEDYYQKELELIGMQEVYNREVYADGSAADGQVFGYQDRYSEYRHQYSSIAAEFRTLLDYWHLSRKFASLPTLNQSFIECDPSKRIFAEQTQHSCWIMASHSIQARRMVGKKTIGRII